ncbi:MAG TPA: ATP-binding protein [Pyrinomonadaceae bacterium]|nr:ATP-binding protein [Pyrinomonadaceae bacterium]
MSLATQKDGSFQSRELLQEMISSIREGVIIVDRDGRVLASNPAARSLLAGGEKIESRRLEEVVADQAAHDAIGRALKNGESTETKIEIAVRHDNRVYDLRAAPLSFAEKRGQRHAIGIFYDITRLERLEKVRQEFLSNVSHELRTPLTSILTFVETLDDGGLEDEENSRRFLQVIRRNAERMHHLIDDVLELSLIEAGKVTVNPAAIQLAPLVDEAWSSLTKKAQKRGISFENQVPRATTVFADSRRLEQILINLMSNAIKFNREGGTVIVAYEESGGSQHIHVADNGDGIERLHLPRIFERFYRTDSARSRELGGTGLGLAIVKHLARLHHGAVTVISTIGTGSTFTVSLPAQPSATETQTSA